MANKQKLIVERLEQIKARASEMNAQQKTKGAITGADLAEEAAGLGLELAQLHDAKGKVS